LIANVGPFVVRPSVVISQKPSKVDAWLYGTLLAPPILLANSERPRHPWGTITPSGENMVAGQFFYRIEDILV